MATLFGTPTPGNFASDAPGWTLGSTIVCAVGANPAVRGRWYMPSGITGTVGYRIYNDGTGALLKSGTFPSLATGWQETDTFATPLEVSGLTITACVFTSASGHYPFDLGIWPVSSGNLTGTGGRNTGSGDVFPGTTTTACYYVDVVVEAPSSDATFAVTLPASIIAMIGGNTADATFALTLPAIEALGTVGTTSPEGVGPIGSSGWWGLLAIGREAAQEDRMERERIPIACPSDGEPLRQGPGGVLYCTFDGWQYPRDDVR